MKNIIRGIAVVLSIVMILGTYMLVVAEETPVIYTTESELSYTVDTNNEITITGYSGSSPNLEIPESIEGKIVTSIGNEAFINNKNIASIDFPESLKVLGRMAFWGCNNIVNLEFPQNLELIGASAFQACSSLKKVIIFQNTNLEYIDDGVHGKGNIIFDSYPSDFRIYCYKDSPAEAYATEWSIPFVYNDWIPLTGITLPDEITVKLNEKTEIPITLTPEDSYQGFHKADTYSLTGNGAADIEITDEGKVYITANEIGTDYLSLTKFAVYNYIDNHIISNTCKINIIDPNLINATSITLKDENSNIINNSTLQYDTYTTGYTYPITVETVPADANEDILFTSTNEYLASASQIDGKYILTLQRGYFETPRTCTITATGKRSGMTAAFDVTVFYSGAESITFDTPFLNNKEGKVNRIVQNSEYDMTVKVVPDNLINDSIITITQNPQTTGQAVISYDQTTGKLKSAGVGTATLKAECKGKSVSYDFEVLPYENKATSITVNTNEKVTKTDTGYALALNVNDTYQLSATVVPEDTTDVLKWCTSINSGVINADTQGNITALKEGTATIKVYSCSYLDVNANAQSEYVTITVTAPNKEEMPEEPLEILATDIDLAEENCTLNIGDTLQLTPVVIPANTTDKVKFNTNKADVAIVSDTGLVTVVGAGTAWVGAEVRGMQSWIVINVKAPITPPVLSLSTSSVSLKNGENFTISGMIAGNTNVTPVWWDTENVNIADITENGQIIARGPGSTRIIGTIYCFDTKEYYQTYCDVIVAGNTISITPTLIQEISLNTMTLTLGYGETNTLNAALYPQGASGTISWMSNNVCVATVNNGHIVAQGPGTCQINATCNGITSTCSVTVNPGSIQLNATKFNLQNGKTIKTLKICSASYKNDKIVNVVSSNTKVLKASLNGNQISLKGLKTYNKYVMVTVNTESGATATCQVKVVKDKVATSKLSLNKKSVTLTNGASETLIVTQTPISSTDKLTWSSSNKKIATVDKNGKIIAKKKGKTTITLKSSNGKKVTCKVQVY